MSPFPVLDVPLSVLDLSFVVSGGTGPQALAGTLELARHVDGLGYTRFWVAEHHNLPSVASGAPDIMAGQILAATKKIRAGSGGVMLPNHSPLMVAERFKVLEGLYPGRVDLGLGRAPGTDQLTALALRRRRDVEPADDFLERLKELMAWETGGWPDDHPFRSISVMPVDVPLPPIWLLGSSGYSARLAAQLGLGFAFAHHFATHDVLDAMLSYRKDFRPSLELAKPHAILALAVVCADTDAEAEYLAGSIDLSHLRRQHGEYRPIPSPEEAAAFPYTEADRRFIARNRARVLVGGPARVAAGLARFVETTQADELMIATAIHDLQAKKRSYELLAEIAGVAVPA
ncbi:LLM class flavin-dependent oxidoreductase [Ancylobacter defluvii]|uniref:Luciferase-like monooxygenase n=1 Tax=Ancylobacter defluvii TaxID=1282440 RepID=A0A9W6K000_9HYPH|nr:LLM class flavin-dependent oxidoreductase [Ancylobacter defluvii]MBS7586977.1 LLM class flavin-dependent oxidoreductase [Ancylobacter defluvii]GLK86282.1 N5,N10-methylene tetrahydromethanopterin reductase [Ancylobacter defluvii]